MSDRDTRQGHGLVVEEAKPRLKRPPLYQVVLLNDDFTPMEFVDPEHSCHERALVARQHAKEFE